MESGLHLTLPRAIIVSVRYLQSYRFEIEKITQKKNWNN